MTWTSALTSWCLSWWKLKTLRPTWTRATWRQSRNDTSMGSAQLRITSSRCTLRDHSSRRSTTRCSIGLLSTRRRRRSSTNFPSGDRFRTRTSTPETPRITDQCIAMNWSTFLSRRHFSRKISAWILLKPGFGHDSSSFSQISLQPGKTFLRMSANFLFILTFSQTTIKGRRTGGAKMRSRERQDKLFAEMQVRGVWRTLIRQNRKWAGFWSGGLLERYRRHACEEKVVAEHFGSSESLKCEDFS